MPSTTAFTDLVAKGKLPLTALFSSTAPVTGNPAMDVPLAAITPPTGTGATDALFALGFGPRADDPTMNLINNKTRLAVLMDAMANPDGAMTTPPTGMPAATLPSNSMRAAAWKNDLRGWTPGSPMLLCAGNGDPTVFFAINTGLMAQLWAPYVAGGLVTVLDVDSSGNPLFGPVQAGFAQAKAAVYAQAEAASAGSGAMAVTMNYHGTLVPPFCNAAALGFFKNFAP
jgi:hypothetical protein